MKHEKKGSIDVPMHAKRCHLCNCNHDVLPFHGDNAFIRAVL